jgi:hypothetical protein
MCHKDYFEVKATKNQQAQEWPVLFLSTRMDRMDFNHGRQL